MVIPLAAFSPPADPAKVKQVCDGLGVCSPGITRCELRRTAGNRYLPRLVSCIRCQHRCRQRQRFRAEPVSTGFQGLEGHLLHGSHRHHQYESDAGRCQQLCLLQPKGLYRSGCSPTATPNASATAYIEGTGYVTSSGSVDLLNAYATGIPARWSLRHPRRIQPC